MSRQSGSSRHHRSHQSRNTETNQEDVIEQVKGIVTALYDVTSTRPHEWELYLPSARSAMTALDQIRFFRDLQRFAEQIWIINGLQDFAFHDADNGSIRDIAEWCQSAWLRILRNYPENVESLTGLGRNWLQRSQAALARIHLAEGSDSSSGGSAQAGAGNSPHSSEPSPELNGTDSPCPAPAADPLRQGQLYVEARGCLQPAVDFYARAVRAANAAGSVSGEILASAAESQMSMGNVTASPGDVRYFTQALRYLRRAEAVPGYQLSVYLQQYLDEYGRYVT